MYTHSVATMPPPVPSDNRHRCGLAKQRHPLSCSATSICVGCVVADTRTPLYWTHTALSTGVQPSPAKRQETAFQHDLHQAYGQGMAADMDECSESM